MALPPSTPNAPTPPPPAGVAAPAGPLFTLLTNAQVDGEGVFLAQVVAVTPPQALPPVRLADAPAFGQRLTLTRAQLFGVMRKAAPDLNASLWAGAAQVRITRRARVLGEAELKEQLTAVLQRDCVQDKGRLELRLGRPWAPMLIPDEPYTVKVLDLPASGVGPHFIVRFELVTARERLGPWQAPLQARVWREVWVAREPLRAGTPLAEANLARERRDVLAAREPLLGELAEPERLELAETVAAGAMLYARAVRLRPVVRRGQIAEAQLVDGAMTISLKVEVLEAGAPGQIVRLRNLQSRRELKGKVQDEQKILVEL